MADGVVNRATAKISLDSRGLVNESKVVIAAGKDMAKAMIAASKQIQAERKVELEQARAVTAVMRSQQSQMTAAARAESATRIAAARAEASARQQAARVAAAQAIEIERRATAEFRSELRAREQAARSSQRTQSIAGGAGGGMLPALGRGIGGALAAGTVIAGVERAGRFALESEAIATAYRRQSVAAEQLAGSQGRLNQLLRAFEGVTGGAVDDATALAQVTSLITQGFAESEEQLKTFLTGVRGASIAMGRPQEFIIERAQFEMLNQTGQRLNEIGLSMEEVRARTAALRNENQGLTKEQAYQQAILDSLAQKFGELATSEEGQATGVEELGVAWRNFGLEVGQTVDGPLNDASRWLATGFPAIVNALRQLRGEAAIPLPGSAGWNQGGWAGGGTFGGAGGGGGGGFGGPAASGSTFTPEQETAIARYGEARLRIERNTYEQIQQEAIQYGQQRARTIAQYNRSALRDEQDFARTQQRQAEQLAEQIVEIRKSAAAREAQAAQELADNLARMRADASRQEARWQRDLDRSIADAREDSAKRQAESLEALNESVAEAREDSAERMAEQQANLDERLTEARQDSLERINELERDYQRNRERAALAHRDTLLDAAARLDARAVWQEQRRYAREEEERTTAHNEAVAEERERLAEFEREAQQAHAKAVAEEQRRLQEFIDEANKAHRERLADEREALNERIEQERESHALRLADAKEALDQQIAGQVAAHERQLAEARAADEQRIIDMKAALVKQQAQEAADRAIRLGRLAEDHKRQLAELDSTHNTRIAQINDHAERELEELNKAHAAELEALGLALDDYKDAWTEFYEDGLIAHKKFLQDLLKLYRTGSHPSENDPYVDLPTPPAGPQPGVNPGGGAAPVPPSPTPYGAGSFASFHSERRQLALNTPAHWMMRTPVYPMPMPQVTVNSGSAGAASISTGDIHIHGAPTDSPQQFAEQFDRELVRVLRNASGQA